MQSEAEPARRAFSNIELEIIDVKKKNAIIGRMDARDSLDGMKMYNKFQSSFAATNLF
jgi:hypothetical protein